MAFSIKNPEVDRLARELARATGESLTQVVETALRERLERVRNPRAGMAQRLRAIGNEVAALPDHDPRPMDELLDYDENGLPA